MSKPANYQPSQLAHESFGWAKRGWCWASPAEDHMKPNPTGLVFGTWSKQWANPQVPWLPWLVCGSVSLNSANIPPFSPAPCGSVGGSLMELGAPDHTVVCTTGLPLPSEGNCWALERFPWSATGMDGCGQGMTGWWINYHSSARIYRSEPPSLGRLWLIAQAGWKVSVCQVENAFGVR